MPWREVGVELRRERNRRGLTQADFARRINVSPRVLGSIERGTNAAYSLDTVDRVELALGWAPGSVAAVLHGGRHVVAEHPDLARIRAAWDRLPERARRRLADIAEDFAAAH